MDTKVYPELPEFYDGKTVAITGGTGFLGQAIIEKLLRCCPKIKKIFLFIRSKKGITAHDRLVTFWNQEIFDNIRITNPTFFKKLVCLPCDLKTSLLGLDIESQNAIIKEVNIFIHSAACLRFNEHIRESFEINVQATRKVIRLCSQIINLEAFVHISTAFANCNRTIIEEKVYSSSSNYKDLENSLKWMKDKTLNMILPELLDGRPNTYTLTKSMAEEVISDEGDGLPCCIVRPAMIIAAYKDPVPGWISNVYGPTAFLAAYMKGLCRHIVANRNMKAELIPVDFVVNVALVAAMKTACDVQSSTYEEYRALEDCSNVPVYHAVTGNTNPLRSQDLYNGVIYWNSKHPANPILPLSDCMSSNHWTYSARVFFTQTIPSYLLDFILFCNFQKPKFVRINNKILSGMNVLEYFFTRPFDIKFDKTQKLLNLLHKNDKKEFNFDPSEIDWWNYFEFYVKGTQKYILKENENDLEYARKKLYWFQLSLSCIKMFSYLGISITIPNAFNPSSFSNEVFLY